MARFVDLDDILVEDVTVKLNGVEYLLPGDVPIEQLLTLQAAWDRMIDGDASLENVGVLSSAALALFRVRQPELVDLPIGIRQIGKLVAGVYGTDDVEDGAGVPTSAPAKRAGAARGTTRRSPKQPARKARASA